MGVVDLMLKAHLPTLVIQERVEVEVVVESIQLIVAEVVPGAGEEAILLQVLVPEALVRLLHLLRTQTYQFLQGVHMQFVYLPQVKLRSVGVHNK